MTDDMIYYLTNGLLCLIQVFFLCINLKPKLNHAATFFIIFIPFCAAALSQKVLYFISPVLLVAVAVFIFILLTFLLFSDPAKSKAFVAVVIWIVVYVVTMIMTSLIKINGGDINSPNLVVNMFHNIAVIVVLTIYTVIRKRLVRNISISSYDTVVFVLVPVSQIILMSAIAFLYNMDKLTMFNGRAVNSDIDRNYVFTLVIVAVLFCVAADVVLFFLVKRISLNDKLREEIKFMDYQNKINFDYYRAMEEKAVETKKIKHDISNVLQIAYSMIEKGTESDAAISSEILAQLKASVAEIQIESYSENDLINAIISNKMSECKREGVEADFDIRVPEKLSVEELDLCKALVNIIDNAIEAVLSLTGEKRKIEIAGFVDGGYLYIKSRNAVSSSDKPKILAGKDRGYGHKILSDTAEKYSGAFITENKDGYFTALMTMKL